MLVTKADMVQKLGLQSFFRASSKKLSTGLCSQSSLLNSSHGKALRQGAQLAGGGLFLRYRNKFVFMRLGHVSSQSDDSC